MQEYLDIIKTVLEKGQIKENRTGIDTLSYFGAYYKIDLAKGFPLLTTKKVKFDSILHELLWFLSGETHIKNLKDKTKIWNAWTSEERNWELGQTYGYQWTKWDQFIKDSATGEVRINHINQIQKVIDDLKKNPYSRRMVVSAWNPADFYRQESDPKKTVQPSACHTMFMFFVSPDKKLSCHLTQRSGDLMLGVPFNLASYAILTQMLAQECGYELGEFSHYINDCHIYVNHIEGAKLQLQREPRELPQLRIINKPFWELKFEDFELLNYNPELPIKFEIAV
ncbi:thymidylate synthase [Candidatus Woesearchaeota archaeon]|nr:thymidylate synthase [Candidatus Woesearchaeota archaeon]